MASRDISGTDRHDDGDAVEIEVVYAEPQCHALVRLILPAGSTLRQAVAASGLPSKFPQIDLAKNRLGIHGKIAKADTLLAPNDRVEIYRPLIADPKETRQRRAATVKPKRPQRTSRV